ncbi:hypothetical protein D3C74_297630 [compost metagenome]
MDKQPKLIDADKLLGWINTELAKEYPESVNQYVDGRETLLEILKMRLEQGKFNPDPIPPTINPKDRVRHRSIKTKGFVVETSDFGALIYWETGQRSWYPFEYLEVSHD